MLFCRWVGVGAPATHGLVPCSDTSVGDPHRRPQQRGPRTLALRHAALMRRSPDPGGKQRDVTFCPPAIRSPGVPVLLHASLLGITRMPPPDGGRPVRRAKPRQGTLADSHGPGTVPALSRPGGLEVGGGGAHPVNDPFGTCGCPWTRLPVDQGAKIGCTTLNPGLPGPRWLTLGVCGLPPRPLSASLRNPPCIDEGRGARRRSFWD